MAPSTRNGIPVPREQRNAGQGRRPSLRDIGQAPWRSSLDLVWSYSRSQAFYGENIATSPSFADRHWAGPSGGIDSSVEEEDDDDEDEEVLTEDASILDDDDEDGDVDDDYDGHADLTASPAGPMDWGDEQLPVNAYNRRGVARASAAGGLGRRERRMEGRSPRDRQRATDRRLTRLAAGDETDEERSRSRSRSPKRLNVVRPKSSLRSGQKSSYGSESSGQSEAIPTRDQKTLSGDKAPTERTPLLDPSALEARRVKDRLPRTPSWFRSSAVSNASNKFQLQGYGTSTFWQSWFNTVNALIGVGILALPLAISYAGLVPGVLLFVLCGLVTNYTGKVLANIMATEPSLRTYADIGNFAFGTRARLGVGFFFCIELWAVATALIILFGDSARALVLSSTHDGARGGLAAMANWSPSAYKALGTLIVLPTMFLPLRLLSPISVVGIVSIATLLCVVLSDGLIKKHAPGSLWEPAEFNIGPQWSRVPLSFGLVMSGFSTHPIVPSLFKDMRNPNEFCKMLNWAYIAATIIYLSMGIIGYLMFGNAVSDEITRDLAHTKGYPALLNKVAIWLIIINPLSKFALAARPINATLELMLGVEHSQINRPHLERTRSGKARYPAAAGDQQAGEPLMAGAAAEVTAAQQNGGDSSANAPQTGGSSSFNSQLTERDVAHSPDQNPLAGSAFSLRAAERTANWSKRSKIVTRTAVQVGVTLLIGATAILLPGFERVMAFLGAFLACVTCVFGPLLANLRLLHHEMSRLNVAIDVVILLVFTVVASLGTVWSFRSLA